MTGARTFGAQGKPLPSRCNQFLIDIKTAAMDCGLSKAKVSGRSEVVVS